VWIAPIQPAGAEGIEGRVEVFGEYAEGLKDIEGFSHIILIYHFHLSKEKELGAFEDLCSPDESREIGINRDGECARYCGSNVATFFFTLWPP
jgi:tRNA (Thr-GGU) A37 N-methylase